MWNLRRIMELRASASLHAAIEEYQLFTIELEVLLVGFVNKGRSIDITSASTERRGDGEGCSLEREVEEGRVVTKMLFIVKVEGNVAL
ncbi:hypothetical protein Tco_0769700 [Tanacetum coccineum]|uniref:Uncharacterized protein n=1 Tax=Tanacetum coccineum TaxID=301880 RepID=A0ABQ4ZA47_9ASTR